MKSKIIIKLKSGLPKKTLFLILLILLFFTKVDAQDTVKVLPSIESTYNNQEKQLEKLYSRSNRIFMNREFSGNVSPVILLNNIWMLKNEYLVYFYWSVRDSVAYDKKSNSTTYQTFTTLDYKLMKSSFSITNEILNLNININNPQKISDNLYFFKVEDDPYRNIKQLTLKSKTYLGNYSNYITNDFVIATQVDNQKNVELYLISCNFIKNNLSDIFKELAKNDSLTANNVKQMVDLYFSPISHDSIVIKKFDTKKIILTTYTDKSSKKRGRVDCVIDIKKNYLFTVKVRDKKSLVYAYFDIMKQCAKQRE